jgi:hypothetical protein
MPGCLNLDPPPSVAAPTGPIGSGADLKKGYSVNTCPASIFPAHAGAATAILVAIIDLDQALESGVDAAGNHLKLGVRQRFQAEIIVRTSRGCGGSDVGVARNHVTGCHGAQK